MATKEHDEPKAPTMQRTKIQLETSYAPGSLFTFEGNLVVCESIPKMEYRTIQLSDYSENQILDGIEDRVTAWFQTALRADSQPQPFMCVDKALLNRGETGLKEDLRHSLFNFAEPSTMGYNPTALTMACNKCKKVKTFSSLNNMHMHREALSRDKCNIGECSWRQLDIIFIHPNGNYEAPVPWVYDYDTQKNDIVRRKERCPRCGSKEVCLDEKSAQIGKRYYYCADASCGMKRDSQWLQNDPEWLKRFGANARDNIQYIRMKPISNRSNAVHYTLQDTIIDFGSNQQLDVLTDSSPARLMSAVAKRFNIPFNTPDEETIKHAVVEVRGENEWKEYEKINKDILNNIKMKEVMEEDYWETLDNNISNLQAQAKNIRTGWQEDGLFPTESNIPPNLHENLLERKERFSGRHDPFRLLIEHETLLERIVSDKQMDNGMRYYTPLDHLDEYIGPNQIDTRHELNKHHRKIMDSIGIKTMGLVRKFETMQYSFGYSRVSATPTTSYINNQMVPVRLKLFPRTQIGDHLKHPIFVLKQNNEAIYVRLDEATVRKWLSCIKTFETITEAAIGQQYLEHIPPMDTFLDFLPTPPAPSMPLAVYTLLHSFAHHVMMGVSEFSGLSIGSLGEYVFPADLAFIVYRRGMTMDLGNLTSMLRNNGSTFLKYLDDRRNLGCGSGSLCLNRGGACPDCLLIPEVSCLTQNKLLSRTVLIGKDHPQNCGFNEPIAGFFDVCTN